jgi:glucan biosynthesis protein
VEVEGIQTANITAMGKQSQGVRITKEMDLKQRIFLRQSITRVGLTASSSLKEQGPIGPLLTDFYS